MYNRHPNPPQIGNGSNHQQQLVHPSNPDWATDNNTGGIHRNPDHGHENTIGMHPAMSQVAPNNNVNTSPMRLQMPLLPPPPVPSDHGSTDQDRQIQVQYEQWLYHQQQILNFHLKHFDGEVAKLRKTKKVTLTQSNRNSVFMVFDLLVIIFLHYPLLLFLQSLNSKQRQLRKNGSELNENDAIELERVVKELSGIQKQLEQARKQTRAHGTLIQVHSRRHFKEPVFWMTILL